MQVSRNLGTKRLVARSKKCKQSQTLMNEAQAMLKKNDKKDRVALEKKIYDASILTDKAAILIELMHVKVSAINNFKSKMVKMVEESRIISSSINHIDSNKLLEKVKATSKHWPQKESALMKKYQAFEKEKKMF